MIVARLPFVALALVSAVLGVYLARSSATEARLGRASADVRADRHADALAELRGLGGEAGRRAAPLRGYAHLGLGQVRKARTALRSAVRRDPNNWIVQRDYAIVLLRLGEREKAAIRMRSARALNPRMPLPPGFVPATRR